MDGTTAHARVRLSAGETVSTALSWARSWQAAPRPPHTTHVRLQDTLSGWQSWSGQHQRFQGRWSERVRLAGIVLQGLTFQPTGAIIAAATTSLPEAPGGGRNWDYRYGWIPTPA